MSRDRILSLVQIAIVWIVCWLAYAYGTPLAPTPAAPDLATRLAFALQWLTVPGALLLASTLVTMSFRLLSTEEALHGTRTPQSRFLEICLRVNQNTLEQTVLAAIAWCGLAVALPAEQLGVVPVLAALFAVGRVLFWIGYQIHPVARAIGFGLTALPTAVAIIWLAWQLISG
jgi:hypothetical protein